MVPKKAALFGLVLPLLLGSIIGSGLSNSFQTHAFGVLPSTGFAHSSTSSSANAGASVCLSEQRDAFNSINKGVAILNAENSSAYYSSQISTGEVARYSSSFAIEHWNSSCGVTLIGFNVVFAVDNATGFVEYLVVSENPTSLTPTGVEVQKTHAVAQSCVGNPCSSLNWDGYEAFGANLIYQVYADFTEATPSFPPSSDGNNCGNPLKVCVMGTWVGLEDTYGASDGNLAQDGTFAVCEGGSGCTPKYVAFYENLSSGYQAVNCTSSTGGSVTISGGDTIYAATTNEAAYGPGYSNSLYDYDISDSNSSTSCYSGGNSYSQMTSPDLGVFIVENPQFGKYCTFLGGCGYSALPEFNSVTFSNGEIYDSGAGYISLYSAYSSSYYYQDVMQNYAGTYPSCGSTPTTNINTGSVSSSNTFSSTWKSSQYTPYNDTGC